MKYNTNVQIFPRIVEVYTVIKMEEQLLYTW